MSQSRQLAAIMFTDIVGYTALMGNDEQHAFTLLNKNRQLQKPIIDTFNGRWIKEIGDGTMASFNTVSDAVNAAIKIQEACNAANDFQLRIGIHQGEVVFENDDVFGDAVNIAARIQAAASPGCIFISETVNHNISNKKDIKTRFVKEEVLKNVSQPMKMYQVLFAGSEIIVPVIPATMVIENSIAVLPFANMSSDPEQEFFSDGITEEIINMLAQVSELKVIGRTSSFAFKGKNMDLKVIGDQLKVSYILEGSVRKSGSKLRVTAQLISVADGFHLYSEKFDRELEDIFAIQDEVSMAILNAIKIKLFGAEREAVLKRYTENVEAYQSYLQGVFCYNKLSPDGFTKAIEYFRAAITKDPNYAIAYSGIAFCYMNLYFYNWSPQENLIPKAIQAANIAFKLDGGIAQSHLAVGRIKFHVEWNFKQAEEHFMKALSIEPNNAESHVQIAMLSTVLGNKEKAMNHMQIAISLDPFSLMNLFMVNVAPAILGEMQTVLENGKRMINLDPTFFGGHFFVAYAYIQLGRPQEGFAPLQLAVQLENGPLTLSFLGSVYGFMGDKLKAREVIKQLESMQVNGYIGDVYASIGELDKAFLYYDKAVEMHEGNMLWKNYLFLNIPAFQNDPRTRTLLDRIGVPY